jgi:acyl-CoA reductase-like NAD-dependent aldehyde dehydrogenase
MRDFTMTIGGRREPALESFSVDNPATGEVIGLAPECSAGQLDAAMDAAAQALAGWQASAAARQSGLAALAVAIETNAGELSRLITSEQGKPLTESRDEVSDAAADLRFFAHLEIPAEAVSSDGRAAVRILRRPGGPVAAITPWNFPVATAVSKLAPGLAAGCTMVLKPSPYSLRSQARDTGTGRERPGDRARRRRGRSGR